MAGRRGQQHHGSALRDKAAKDTHISGGYVADEVVNSTAIHISSSLPKPLPKVAENDPCSNSPVANGPDVSCASVSMSVSYRAALDRIVRLSDIFEALQQSQTRLNIMEYSVSQMSLEQVFMRVCGSSIHDTADEQASDDKKAEQTCDEDAQTNRLAAGQNVQTRSSSLPRASSYNCISLDARSRDGLAYAQLRRSNARLHAAIDINID